MATLTTATISAKNTWSDTASVIVRLGTSPNGLVND